jgi:hypothetical protein
MHRQPTNPITDADNTSVYSHKGAEVKYNVNKTQAICHALQDTTRQMSKRPLNQ